MKLQASSYLPEIVSVNNDLYLSRKVHLKKNCRVLPLDEELDYKSRNTQPVESILQQ